MIFALDREGSRRARLPTYRLPDYRLLGRLGGLPGRGECHACVPAHVREDRDPAWTIMGRDGEGRAAWELGGVEDVDSNCIAISGPRQTVSMPQVDFLRKGMEEA